MHAAFTNATHTSTIMHGECLYGRRSCSFWDACSKKIRLQNVTLRMCKRALGTILNSLVHPLHAACAINCRIATVIFSRKSYIKKVLGTLDSTCTDGVLGSSELDGAMHGVSHLWPWDRYPSIPRQEAPKNCHSRRWLAVFTLSGKNVVFPEAKQVLNEKQVAFVAACGCLFHCKCVPGW